ncbi:MAG: YlxR family protein [Myxococcales bacterium]|nr:YlxR family protein [Myxococcales bacterium]
MRTGPKKRSGRRAGPIRTCLGCRRKLAHGASIRLVAGPDGAVLPDLTGRLPGRGARLCPDPACIRRALETGALRRALEANLRPPPWEELLETLRAAQERQARSILGAAGSGGFLVTGHDAVRRRLNGGGLALLLLAPDAGEALRREMLELCKLRTVPWRELTVGLALPSRAEHRPFAVGGILHRGLARSLATHLDNWKRLLSSPEDRGKRPAAAVDSTRSHRG